MCWWLLLQSREKVVDDGTGVPGEHELMVGVPEEPAELIGVDSELLGVLVIVGDGLVNDTLELCVCGVWILVSFGSDFAESGLEVHERTVAV
ncbi:hypothetical protein AXK59_16750 [Tsukamurella tyrosinosolvens]|nr:hypothetical protein AXK59_16750 [Tsukamurella tyrosinosolvens]